MYGCSKGELKNNKTNDNRFYYQFKSYKTKAAMTMKFVLKKDDS